MRQQSLSSPPETLAFTSVAEPELPCSENQQQAHEQKATELSDPFYDQHADSDDERWVASNLLHVAAGQDSLSPPKEKPRVDTPTDPVSCPSCFSVLSLQTQPHLRFEGQFRALFVTNCKIVRSQRLRVSDNRRTSDQVYQPVACAHCQTEVGVRDHKGVYHFCNVMY